MQREQSNPKLFDKEPQMFVKEEPPRQQQQQLLKNPRLHQIQSQPVFEDGSMLTSNFFD